MAPLIDRIKDARKEAKILNNQVKEATGLSDVRALVLVGVNDRPCCTQTVLSQKTHVDRSTTGIVVAALVKAGLLKRTRQKNDKRMYTLRLTPEGDEMVRKILNLK